MRRILIVLVCVACGYCGSQSPTGPNPGPPPPGSPPPTAAARPPQPPAGPQTFVGAGDIAMCDRNSLATAALLDSFPGAYVFTLGDNAYVQGTRQRYRDGYDNAWGRHKGRTFPVPGNHEYESAGALPYFEYF